MTHPYAVALILDRLGVAEDVLIAALLHDVIEDTGATAEDIQTPFGTRVAELVSHCSEVKLDAEGRKRSWEDRKRDHLAALDSAPVEAKMIVLADKLHGLVSIRDDLAEGRDVWPLFNAPRARVIEHYRETLSRLGHGDPTLETLAALARTVLAEIETADNQF